MMNFRPFVREWFFNENATVHIAMAESRWEKMWGRREAGPFNVQCLDSTWPNPPHYDYDGSRAAAPPASTTTTLSLSCAMGECSDVCSGGMLRRRVLEVGRATFDIVLWSQAPAPSPSPSPSPCFDPAWLGACQNCETTPQPIPLP